MGLMNDNKGKDYRSKKKLSYEERIIIERYLKDDLSKTEIAKRLRRDYSTIKREIKRNGYYNWWWYWVYKAKTAQERTEKRRIKANIKHTRLFTWEWREFVEEIKEKMKEKDWSISATIWRYELEKWKKAKLSISTMYRYAREYDKDLEKLLLYKSWWYKKWEYKYWKNSKIQELESIENREEVINKRERIWDYEVDLIVSKKSKEVILNLIDRRSRNIWIKKIGSKKKNLVKEAIIELLKWKEVRSITTDNGTEFTDLIDICKELWIKWYRCHPYSSWEKWSVEIHNRYIRRYIPKWADIKDYSEEYIETISNKINNLPRKIHWYKTPEEIFYWKNIRYFD